MILLELIEHGDNEVPIEIFKGQLHDFTRFFRKSAAARGAKGAAVAYLQTVMSLSERRACSMGADRKMIRFRSLPPPNVALRGRVAGCVTSSKSGYVLGYYSCCWEGEAGRLALGDQSDRAVSRGRAHRPQAARRRGRGARAPIVVEANPAARRSLDFIHDQFESPASSRTPLRN